MRLKRILAPATALMFAAAVEAQVRPPASPPAAPPSNPGTSPKSPSTPSSPGTSPTTPGTSPSTPGTSPTTPGTPGSTPGRPGTTPTEPGRPGTTPTDPGRPATPTTPPVSPGAGGTATRPVSPGAGGPANTLPTPLFRQNGVPRSLSLNDRQVGQLGTMTERLEATFQDRLNALNRLPEADRAAAARELNRTYTSEWMAAARGIMTADQLNRYQQLQLQFGGFTSLSDPGVQRQLSLTADQQRRLNDSIAWSDEQMRLIQQQAVSDRDRAVRMYNDYNRAYQDRLGQFLTADQMRTWQGMVGDPFTFQPQFPSTTTGGVGGTSGTTPKR